MQALQGNALEDLGIEEQIWQDEEGNPGMNRYMPRLLQELMDALPGDFTLRVSTGDPARTSALEATRALCALRGPSTARKQQLIHRVEEGDVVLLSALRRRVGVLVLISDGTKKTAMACVLSPVPVGANNTLAIQVHVVCSRPRLDIAFLNLLTRALDGTGLLMVVLPKLFPVASDVLHYGHERLVAQYLGAGFREIENGMLGYRGSPSGRK